MESRPLAPRETPGASPAACACLSHFPLWSSISSCVKLATTIPSRPAASGIRFQRLLTELPPVTLCWVSAPGRGARRALGLAAATPLFACGEALTARGPTLRTSRGRAPRAFRPTRRLGSLACDFTSVPGPAGHREPGSPPTPPAGRCQYPASPNRLASAGLKGLRPRAWAPGPGPGNSSAQRPAIGPGGAGQGSGRERASSSSSSLRLLLCSEFLAPLPPPAPQPGPAPSLPFFLPRLPAAKEAHLL